MTEERDKPDRNDLAEDRTVLANERTFAGWMRTAIAAVGMGVAFHALFDQMEPRWAPRAIASAFVISGLIIIFLAERKSRRVLNRLNAHSVEPVGGLNLALVGGMIAAGSVTLLAGIWLLV